MPVVKLNQSRPHSPPVLSDRKRTLGINHIHTQKISFSSHIHLQPHSYTPHTVFTHPVPAPKRPHLSSLSEGSTGTSRGGPGAAASHVPQPRLGPAKQCSRNKTPRLVTAVTQPKHPHQRSPRIHISQRAIDGFWLPWGLTPRPSPMIIYSKRMSQMDNSPTLMGPPHPHLCLPNGAQRSGNYS